MAKIVLFTGSPGAGKTSVLDKVRKRGKYRIVSIGTLMEKDAAGKYGIVDRDKIRELEMDQINKLRADAFKQVAKMKGNIILDTHASISHRGRYIPGMPTSCVKWLKGLCAFIYIDADNHELLARRINDKNRKRDFEEPKEIDTHRLINLAMLSQHASDLNISLYIIHNKEARLGQTVNKALELLNTIFKG